MSGTVNQLVNENPQSREKKIDGWLPGIVVDLSDPLELGRVRVICPLIDETKPLPNNHDGWVQMLNPSSGKGAPGGSQNLIQINDQIVLLPMLGDLKNCIGLGVLHSNVDPPSRHFDRPKGVYGSHTPNGDIEVKDESNRRSLKTFNGYTETVDALGNKNMVGPGGAGVYLAASGDARIDNQTGSIGVSAEGDVNLVNSKADMCLSEDGTVSVMVEGSPSLLMGPDITEIVGQRDPIAQQVKEVKEAALHTMSLFPTWRGQLKTFAIELQKNLSYEDRLLNLYGLDEALADMVNGFRLLVVADKPLAKLQEYEPIIIGSKIAGQLDKFRDRDLADLMEKYAGSTISQGVIDNLPEEMEGILGAEVTAGIDFGYLQTTLTGLQHNPEEQIKAILESVVPLGQIDSIINRGLHTNLDRLNSFVRKVDDLQLEDKINDIDSFGENQAKSLTKIFQQIEKIAGIAPPFDPAATKVLVSRLKSANSQIRKGVETLQGQLKDAQTEFTKIVDLKDNYDLEEEFGNEVVEHIGEATKCIGNIKPVMKKLEALADLTTILLKLDSIDRVDEVTQLYEMLPLLEQYFDLEKYEGLVFNEGGYIQLGLRVETIQQVIIDYTLNQIPAAITSLLAQIEVDMEKGYKAIKGIEATISSETTVGGIKMTNTGAVSDVGAVGGRVVQNETRAALVAPQGDKGLGSQIIAEDDKAIISSAGAGTKLESKVEVSTEGIELKAPSAELGLGVWFKLNQEECYFWAPGAKENQMGSMFHLNQERILLSSAGGETAGSNLEIKDDTIAINAPGGKNGSGLVIDVDSAGLFSPGGRTGGGTSVRCEPEQLRLTLSGITGGNIFLKRNQIKSEIPLMRSEMTMRSNRIQIRSLMAKVDVSPVSVKLSVAGASIQILPGVVRLNGVVLVNNLPLTPGNFW